MDAVWLNGQISGWLWPSRWFVLFTKSMKVPSYQCWTMFSKSPIVVVVLLSEWDSLQVLVKVASGKVTFAMLPHWSTFSWAEEANFLFQTSFFMLAALGSFSCSPFASFRLSWLCLANITLDSSSDIPLVFISREHPSGAPNASQMVLQLLWGLAVGIGLVLLRNEAEVAALRTEARMKVRKATMMSSLISARFSSYSGPQKDLEWWDERFTSYYTDRIRIYLKHLCRNFASSCDDRSSFWQLNLCRQSIGAHTHLCDNYHLNCTVTLKYLCMMKHQMWQIWHRYKCINAVSWMLYTFVNSSHLFKSEYYQPSSEDEELS